MIGNREITNELIMNAIEIFKFAKNNIVNPDLL